MFLVYALQFDCNVIFPVLVKVISVMFSRQLISIFVCSYVPYNHLSVSFNLCRMSWYNFTVWIAQFVKSTFCLNSKNSQVPFVLMNNGCSNSHIIFCSVFLHFCIFSCVNNIYSYYCLYFSTGT